MYKVRKHIKYQHYRVICYTGRIGSGLTLAAVIQLVKETKNHPDTQIVSNIHLDGLNHELFDYKHLDKLLSYQNKLLLFDCAYLLFDARQHTSAQNKTFLEFFEKIEENNNRVILTSHRLEFIDKDIRNKIDGLFICRRFAKRTHTLILDKHHKWSRDSYHLKGASRYFRYYSQLEAPPILAQVLEQV